MTEYWYNTRTGQVEEGKQSLGIDRVGPFASHDEAASAPELMQQRAEAWAEEDAEEERNR